MPELYYIFKLIGTEHNTDSWYATQALADAAAVERGADFASNLGAVAIPNGWEIGWIRNPDDGAWRVFAVIRPGRTRPAKVCSAYLARCAARVGSRRQGRRAREADHRRAPGARLPLLRPPWANYVVFTNANDTWSAAQQIAWAYAMTAGAADITTVQEFFEHAHTIEEAKFRRRRARG